jgi:hypothetical protein
MTSTSPTSATKSTAPSVTKGVSHLPATPTNSVAPSTPARCPVSLRRGLSVVAMYNQIQASR